MNDAGPVAGRPRAQPGALESRLAQRLERIRAQNLYRVRRAIDGSHGARITIDGRACLNFCSNDYLGLAADPRVAAAAQRALGESGTGSGAAMLVSGYNREHRALEEELAAFTRQPRALLFSSGWAANLGVLRALLGRDDTLIADELNHASLIDGGRLCGAQYRRVAHTDPASFREALRQSSGQVVIATDALFSMDGDLAPLPALATLARAHGAARMVDDAHGFGVLGRDGRGSVEHCGGDDPDIYVATLGKALGCAGAFVAGSETLIEFLVQRARSWVFSTAPPPALAAAARAALRLAGGDEGARLRQQLRDNIERFRTGARQLGIPLGARLHAGASETAIQPIVLGDETRALAVSRELFERGFWVAAIRPPTVPRGTARLRLTLSAVHSAGEIDRVVDALATALAAVPER